ncbi:hypothetical protein HOP50_04g29820 [Chloropicon primus]|uniref:Saposin B-type domain-containing protein n=1 Tax=Chloropicon primus TaxID=1764295 RepID=A0A5B8MLE8_9CHLO|nr:hypothetical protein A3770_04p29830 [Chloropicon primus]UPQ99674.1 hypothetical protein HOP50_04g29820 [Chloropicon primus]|mmetsp:Transcript_12947/g.36304  ORF Transcript_12947/g.36304 Transcript_12947/m.36304 type:complete len:217 (+) Transcript_12947:408-1058(+)|eukprot:QDZ20465.1 hypothetical protein A3770_04p29830 [Chloropicon primus]
MTRVAFSVAVIMAAVCTASAVRIMPFEKPVVAPVTPVQGDALLCELCDYATGWVENYLKANGTEEKITKFVVNDVCPKLPANIAGICASYAPMLLSYAIQTVEHEIDTGKLCDPLCGKKTKEAIFGLPAPLKSEIKPLKDTCDVCEKAAAKVHDFLSQPGEIDKIVNFIEEVCELVPSDEHDKCVSTITGFGPMVLNYLVGLTANPQQACAEISLC